METAIQIVIKTYGLEIGTKPNGEIGLKVTDAKAKKQIEEVKATIEKFGRENIMNEIKAIEKARQEAKEAKEKEYIKSANIRRFLVCKTDENYKRTYSFETLEIKGEKATVPQISTGVNYIEIAHETKTVEIVENKAGYMYGMNATAWEITAEEEATITEEQEPAAKKEKEEKEKQEAEKKAEEEAKINEKFAEAKITGKPVQIRKWSEHCNSPKEECSMDILTEFALPDGTTKITRTHTW